MNTKVKKGIIILSIFIALTGGSYLYFVNRNKIRSILGLPSYAYAASPDAYQTLRDAEGLRLNAYQNSGDVPTIGYGHTKGVKLGQSITEAQAEQYLADDVHYFESRLNSKPINLNQNQYDASLTFMFQWGEGNFFKSPMYAKMLVDPNDATIPADFLSYAYPARRQQEATLYATPITITT